MACKATDDPHRRRRPEDTDDDSRHEIAKVYFDYGFFRNRIGEKLVPFLVATCKRTAMKRAFVTQDRIGGMPLTVRLVDQCLRELGHHGPVVLRSDGEQVLQELLTKVATGRQAQTLVERGAREDGACNGRAERAVRTTEEQTKLIKLDFEKRSGVGVSAHSSLFTWMVRHGVDLFNKRQPGFDGRTPFERLRGRPYQGELLPFGAPVLHRLSGLPVGGVLVDRWNPGSWLGKTSDSDEQPYRAFERKRDSSAVGARGGWPD